MRVSDIEFISDDVEIMKVALRIPQFDDKYLAKAVIGLDAAEIIPKFYGFGLVNKERYYEYTLPPREIVMRVVLNPNYEVNEQYSDLRDELYRMISSSRSTSIKMVLKNGAQSVAQILGTIIKFEVPHFSKVPELQMTIRCEDPILRAITYVSMDHEDLGATQPFDVIDAISTAPHGFDMEVTLLTAKPSFVIQDKATNPNWKFEVAPNGGFLAGDMLCICSNKNDKQTYIERGGVKTHIANSITFGSLWPVIFPGYNEFYSNYSGEIEWMKFEYTPTYWGV
jgi:hypothetical protein